MVGSGDTIEDAVLIGGIDPDVKGPERVSSLTIVSLWIKEDGLA